MVELKRAPSKEENCITCRHCKVFDSAFSDYKGTCELQFSAPVKPTTICGEYKFEEKLDKEALRILEKYW